MSDRNRLRRALWFLLTVRRPEEYGIEFNPGEKRLSDDSACAQDGHIWTDKDPCEICGVPWSELYDIPPLCNLNYNPGEKP